MMPERIAATVDPFKQVTEIVGSGPFRFLPKEYVSGAFAAFEKFDRYKPRNEPASYTAGGHKVLVDRVEWRVIPDSATAANALTAGEVDWLELPQPDLLPMLKRASGVTTGLLDLYGTVAVLRPNHLNAPTSNVGSAAGDVRGHRPERGDAGRDGRGSHDLERADGVFPAELEVGQRGRDGFRAQTAQR